MNRDAQTGTAAPSQATAQERSTVPAVSLAAPQDRKSTRLNSNHLGISYAVFCLKKKTKTKTTFHSKSYSDTKTHTRTKTHQAQSTIHIMTIASHQQTPRTDHIQPKHKHHTSQSR